MSIRMTAGPVHSGPAYNDLTLQCLRAAKGMRRPSIELRVTKDMPDTIWQAAIDSLQTAAASPHFTVKKAIKAAWLGGFADPQKGSATV